MKKARDLIFLQEESQTRLLLAKIKWLICDMIWDCNLIAGRWNSTINPQEQIFPSKWTESSVIYLHQWSVADPRFPQGGAANSPGEAPTYDFAKFSEKLHEIERIWAPRGGTHPCCTPRSATPDRKNFLSFSKHKVIFRGNYEMEQFLTK